jgi:hypothetical protein
MKVQLVCKIEDLDFDETYNNLKKNLEDATINITEKGLIKIDFHGKNNTIMLFSHKGKIQAIFDYPIVCSSKYERRFKKSLEKIEKYFVSVPNAQWRIREMTVLKYLCIQMLNASASSKLSLSTSLSALDDNF